MLRIDDAHVEPRLNRVIQEHCVHRFTNNIVASEGERHVAHAARCLGSGAFLLDLSNCIDEFHRVVRMFFHPRADGQNVGIEDNVGRRETDFLCQQLERSFADADFLFACRGLSDFIKRHHDDCRTVATNQLRFVQKLGFAFFQTDTVDDALAVNALQAGFQNFPVRAVDHDGHTNIVIVQQPQEFLHATRAVEQPFVHIDVDHLRAAFDLIASDADRFVELVFPHKSQKLA